MEVKLKYNLNLCTTLHVVLTVTDTLYIYSNNKPKMKKESVNSYFSNWTIESDFFTFSCRFRALYTQDEVFYTLKVLHISSIFHILKVGHIMKVTKKCSYFSLDLRTIYIEIQSEI